MGSRRVTAPDGQTYAVDVLWLPRHLSLWRRFSAWRRRRREERRRKKDSDSVLDSLDVPVSFDAEDFAIGFAVTVALVASVFLFWWLLLPLALILIDVIVLLVLVLVGTIARVLFRRPWTVTVHDDDGLVATRGVVGWRAAGAARDQAADDLAAGMRLSPDFSTER